MNSEEIIVFIIKLFTSYLDELSQLKGNEFIHGEMTAYVETLEILQKWKFADKYNLNYTITDKYNI